MKKLALLLIALICLAGISMAQNPQWVNYINGYEITALSEEGNNMWVGTSVGLVLLDKTTGTPTFFNKANSGLPDNYIQSIAIDGSGNKWIGMSGGLAKFDGTTWSVYNTSNSGLPGNVVQSIAIDGSGDKWIGTGDCGLVKFDDTAWTVYNTSNSGLPYNGVTSIAIDGSGNKWIGTSGWWPNGCLAKFDDTAWTVYSTSNSGPDSYVNSITIDGSGNKWIGTWYLGMVKFDGTAWTVYYTSNSGLPGNWVTSIAIDGGGNKWIGTEYGLVKFDGTAWTVYNTSNSGLPDNVVYSIAIDGSGNKWIGTDGGGLAVFNENGISVSIKENIMPGKTVKIFPNPFSASTTIEYELNQSSAVQLTIYDYLGKQVEVIEKKQAQGKQQITWNAEGLPAGVYSCVIKTNQGTQTTKIIKLNQ